MRQMAVRAVFYAAAAFILEIAAAFAAQKIQRAVTKHAVKIIPVMLIRFRYFMAREIFALMIAEKFMIIFHTSLFVYLFYLFNR